MLWFIFISNSALNESGLFFSISQPEFKLAIVCFLTNYMLGSEGKCVPVSGRVFSIDLLSSRIKWPVVASVLLDISNVCTPNIRWASASQLHIQRWWTLEYQISWISIIVQSDQRYHHPTITADIWCSAWNKLQPTSQPVKIFRLISRW